MQINKFTKSFVCLVIGTLLIINLFSLGIPFERLVAYGILMLVEAWALAHKGDGDTISEAVWAMACFPLVPWLSCYFFCYYTMQVHVITNTVEIAALVAIQAHFFWQSMNLYNKING